MEKAKDDAKAGGLKSYADNNFGTMDIRRSWISEFLDDPEDPPELRRLRRNYLQAYNALAEYLLGEDYMTED